VTTPAPEEPPPAEEPPAPAPPAAPPEEPEYVDVWDGIPAFPLLVLAFALATLVAYAVLRLGRDDDDKRGPKPPSPPPETPRHEREVQAALRRLQPAA
jgi:hypothetical protein